jgi:exodeoxyribonuclease-3
LKITTWNINGLRSALSKGLVAWMKSNQADVYCFQEIKADRPIIDGLMEHFPEYHLFWNPAERRGYSGVLTLTKKAPHESQLCIGSKIFDREGRIIITYLEDLVLFNLYFPQGRRDKSRVEYKLAFYALILEICDQFLQRGKQIILAGDFNTAHKEIDLANPRQNQNNTGFLHSEREWLDHYLDHGFVDIFRMRYPQRVQYTWWTYRVNARQRNIGWRLDYFLVSENLVNRVVDVIIQEDVQGSDHCPVSFILL